MGGQAVRPLISVVVPVYNAEDCLERCLGSILAQTYPRFEVLLVDDASTDASGSICGAWASRDQRLSVLHLPANGGPSRARNEGIRRARGELLTFIDADDFVEPTLLEALWTSRQAAGADISVCGYTPGGGTEEPAGVQVYRGGEIVACVIRHIPFGWAAWGKLYPTELVRRSLFDETVYVAEDLLFVYQLAKQAACVSYLPDRLYHYNHRRAGSLLHSPFDERISTAFAAYAYLLQDLSVHDPALLPGFRGELLAFHTAFARDAARCPVQSRQARSQALERIQRSLRHTFSWRAWALCPHGARGKALLLYLSKTAFGTAAVLYPRRIPTRTEDQSPWNSR